MVRANKERTSVVARDTRTTRFQFVCRLRVVSRSIDQSTRRWQNAGDPERLTLIRSGTLGKTISLETLGQCSIKFFALKTSSFFNEIVNEARSVIVAGNSRFLLEWLKLISVLLGGTMRPVSEREESSPVSRGASRSMNLSITCFLPVDNPKRKSFSYPAVKAVLESLHPVSIVLLDHIVPPENVLALALPLGPKNIEFEFTAANRSNTAMVFSLSIYFQSSSGIDLDGWTRSCSSLALFDNSWWPGDFLLLLRSSSEDLHTSGEDIRSE